MVDSSFYSIFTSQKIITDVVPTSIPSFVELLDNIDVISKNSNKKIKNSRLLTKPPLCHPKKHFLLLNFRKILIEFL